MLLVAGSCRASEIVNQPAAAAAEVENNTAEEAATASGGELLHELYHITIISLKFGVFSLRILFAGSRKLQEYSNYEDPANRKWSPGYVSATLAEAYADALRVKAQGLFNKTMPQVMPMPTPGPSKSKDFAYTSIRLSTQATGIPVPAPPPPPPTALIESVNQQQQPTSASYNPFVTQNVSPTQVSGVRETAAVPPVTVQPVTVPPVTVTVAQQTLDLQTKLAELKAQMAQLEVQKAQLEVAKVAPIVTKTAPTTGVTAGRRLLDADTRPLTLLDKVNVVCCWWYSIPFLCRYKKKN